MRTVHMNAVLKAALMVLGSGAVLLLAGAFPLAGAPGVYRGGLMLLLGLAVVVLCLWGAWRVARGHMVRLICGMLCLFLACAGLVAAWRFGELAVGLQGKDDVAGAIAALWFGRVGLLCNAMVGLLFTAIFGFLTLRLMQRRLWLAALHIWVALLLVGANVDFFGAEVNYRVSVPPVSDGRSWVSIGGEESPAIRISVLSFEVQRYEDAAVCTLLHHVNGAWQPVGAPVRQGEEYVLGEERWPVSSLRSEPGMAQRYLLLPGKPLRMLLEGAAPVKDYRAICRLTICRPTGDEVREELLRVNHPISCEGYLIYLMNYTPPTHAGQPLMVDMEVRRAPGRVPALLSMLGIIICTFGWCFSKREEVAA